LQCIAAEAAGRRRSFDMCEDGMTSKRPLRPRVYAQEIEQTIGSAAESRVVLDVAAEAERIAELSGFSMAIVASDLVEAGLAARINMEIPALQKLRRAQAARHPATSRSVH
jgi:hypothetical protein